MVCTKLFQRFKGYPLHTCSRGYFTLEYFIKYSGVRPRHVSLFPWQPRALGKCEPQLCNFNSPRDWSHLTRQRHSGQSYTALFYSFSIGLFAEEVF